MENFFSVTDHKDISNLIINSDISNNERLKIFEETGIKTIGVIGLGLIGASYAKAFKKYTKCRILAYNRTFATTEKAISDGVVDAPLDESNLSECDLIIPSLYPDAIIDYVKENASNFKKGAIIIDAGGLKRKICRELYPIAKANGFTFVGGHPMAGKRYSGYDYSTEDLFIGSSMIVVPEDINDSGLMTLLAKVFLPCGISMLTVTTPEKHDKMIAFTSEMPHIISNSFIKSPTAKEHTGFSAGSYRDVSRVAKINAELWTELFLENKAPLLSELDTLIDNLSRIRNNIANEDYQSLYRQLKAGRTVKEELNE